MLVPACQGLVWVNSYREGGGATKWEAASKVLPLRKKGEVLAMLKGAQNVLR